MAKHPVPKKKTSKARTSRRYKTFQNKARVRLGNAIQMVDCPACGVVIRQHRACDSCGKYRGNDMTQQSAKETAKVTTIKAD